MAKSASLPFAKPSAGRSAKAGVDENSFHFGQNVFKTRLTQLQTAIAGIQPPMTKTTFCCICNKRLLWDFWLGCGMKTEWPRCSCPVGA